MNLTRRLLDKAQRRGGKIAEPSIRHLATLTELAQNQLSPHLEELVDWLTSESTIETLQLTLSKVANTAISMGFRIDPGAALLFEFASWLEEEYGREEVMPRILAHAPLEDGSLVTLLTRAMTNPPDASPDTRDHHVLGVRQRMLLMLCSLAQLEEETPLPPGDDITSLHAYLERAILPEQFDLLADLALGDPDAFDTLQRRHHEAQEAKKRDASMSEKLKLALLDRVVPTEEPAHSSKPNATPRTALTQRGGRTPALTFLTTGYLLFLQTTLTRSMLESFPDLIASLKHTEQEEAARRYADDAIEITPHDDDITS